MDINIAVIQTIQLVIPFNWFPVNVETSSQQRIAKADKIIIATENEKKFPIKHNIFQ